ncbi:MAG: DUF177 domain-containing protein [Chloroflexi bacterium]|nr:DUF177 domain-containing protein [Chloroflexota bacterium]
MSTFSPFRLNVGFIAAQDVGYQRIFDIEVDSVRLDDLELRQVRGEAMATRTPQGILVRTSIQATTPQVCVRCLKPFDQPLSIAFEELYAFSPEPQAEAEQRYPGSGIIDLGPLVREHMILAIPLKPLCHPECKGLCPVCGANLNETSCEHQGRTVDPRWAALQEWLQQAESESLSGASPGRATS